MRKIILALLCIVLLLSLCACQTTPSQAEVTEPTTAPTSPVPQGPAVFKFPEGTVINGIDLSGKLGNAAYTALERAVETYELDLTLNGQTISLTGKDMSLTFHEDAMAAYVDALKNGEDTSAHHPVTYNPKQLESRISYLTNTKPQNATLVYNADTNSFDIQEAIPGTVYELDNLISELENVIGSFSTSHSATVTGRDLKAVITADSDRAKQAQEEANKLLRTALTYSYTPDESKPTYEAITVDHMGQFLAFDENLNPGVDMDAITAYAQEMGQWFSVGQKDGKFLTSLGDYYDMEIYYADQLVDTDALAQDIAYCIENRISGARVAPYLPKEKGLAHDLGGNYVEVNLTEQCLWVYNNYECVMHTPIVTGCLGNDWGTPNGAFAVVYKEIGATLMGLDVTYWMPFYGNYGLHDAPWRRVFNNTEYLFNGSHGCVNIPPVNARAVFHNVSWGTPVIVYGGAHYGHPVQQELYATTEYHVGLNAVPFKLDAKPKYGPTSRLTYTCDNTDVVTVSRKGEITVVGAGTAKITIETPDWDFCPSVKDVVTITVHESCAQQGHMVINWKTTEAPGCNTKGFESGECTSCGISVSRQVDPCHNYDKWKVVTEPTCTEEGLQERVCLACGEKDSEVLSANGHSYFGWKIQDATPTKDGKKSATCYYCKDSHSEVIPATN